MYSPDSCARLSADPSIPRRQLAGGNGQAGHQWTLNLYAEGKSDFLVMFFSFQDNEQWQVPHAHPSLPIQHLLIF